MKARSLRQMGFPFPFERLRLNPQPMPNNHSENRRILIIDDERPILLTLEALLSRHGYQPDTAATASYGLRRIKETSPALVLLDLQLPDGEGVEMLDQT